MYANGDFTYTFVFDPYTPWFDPPYKLKFELYDDTEAVPGQSYTCIDSEIIDYY